MTFLPTQVSIALKPGWVRCWAGVTTLALLAGCETSLDHTQVRTSPPLPSSREIEEVSGTTITPGSHYNLRDDGSYTTFTFTEVEPVTLCAQTNVEARWVRDTFRHVEYERTGGARTYWLTPDPDLHTATPGDTYLRVTVMAFETVTSADSWALSATGQDYKFIDRLSTYGCPQNLTTTPEDPPPGEVKAVVLDNLPWGAAGYSEIRHLTPAEQANRAGQEWKTSLSAFAEIDDRFLLALTYQGLGIDVRDMDIAALLDLTVDRVRQEIDQS